MRKKLLLLLALASMNFSSALAVPAYPGKQTVRQPDGSMITFVVHGDERFNYMTTPDGYLLARDAQGVICYAQFENGYAKALNMMATDLRPAKELQFLQGLEKATDTPAIAKAQQQKMPKHISSTIPLDTFRGLVILVNYSDSVFSMNNPQVFYDKMLNEEGYEGFTDPQGEWRTCTGSLHDYFKDNSLGMFAPHFDVVGPVNVSYNYTFVNQTRNANELMKAALDAADGYVDFSKYDSNGDGIIDMVYFIFPGFGSNSTGGKELWPHASDELGDLIYDGKHMGHYACSTEIFGVPGNGVVEGIGTICHEFSHLLGLPDEYDTSTGGMTHDVAVPGYWSVMSMGCYVDNCLRPVGYSLMERMLAGFSKPDTLVSSTDPVSLSDLATTGKGFLMPSYKDGEYFLFENRQPVKWDANLPGHGLLAYRVDQSDQTLWDNNQINNEVGKEHYLLLRAQPQLNGDYRGAGYKDTPYDPFPGNGCVTTLSDDTSPSLRSLYGYNSCATISDITESNGTVSFHYLQVPQTAISEIWAEDDMDDTQGNLIRGSLASWLLAGDAKKETVLTDEGEQQAITMIKRSSLTATTNISGNVNMMKFTIGNPTQSTAIFQLKYSLDDGATWTTAPLSDGSDNVTVNAGTSADCLFYFNEIPNQDNLRIRITEFSGVSNARCHVGNLTFFTTQNETDGINSPTGKESIHASIVKVFDLQGRLVKTASSQGNALNGLAKGLYLVNGQKHLVK